MGKVGKEHGKKGGKSFRPAWERCPAVPNVPENPCSALLTLSTLHTFMLRSQIIPFSSFSTRSQLSLGLSA